MLTESEQGNNRGTENAPFSENTSFSQFQQQDNEDFSGFTNRKRTRRQPRGPKYRVINRYVKNTRQYWKERNRRKQVWQLSGKLTYKQIAKKLGVSEKTVQRDIKKIRSYYYRLSRKYLRELEQERTEKLNAELEGKTLHQQFEILTKRWIEYQKLIEVRKYVRHLIKVIIDMNDLKAGCPKITLWPSHWSGQLPIHIRFIVKRDGEKEVLGGLTLDRSQLS